MFAQLQANSWFIPLASLVIFVVSMLLGYKIISNVPSLLHTPLMSGMNALSGVTILGALVVMAMDLGGFSKFIAIIAILLAGFNVVGGFAVTDRMLKMFNHDDSKKDNKKEE